MTAPGAHRRAAHDRVGAALLVAFLGWAWLSAFVNHTTAWPLTALVAMVAAVYRAARAHPDNLDVLAGGLVVFLFAAALVHPAVASGGPTAPPLGYGNADGALFGLGVAAAALLAVRTAQPARMVWWSAAIALLLVTAATTSRAATVLALTVVAVARVARRWGPTMQRWCLPAVPLLLAAGVALTVVWAAGVSTPERGPAEAALSSRRVQLWSDAVDMIRANPWFGVGPGRFQVESPTARRFPDTDQTHSEYLQTAAETGLPGAALLTGLVCWTFASLRRPGRDSRAVVIAGTAAAALAVQALIDYVGHFPVLVVLAVALVGAAGAGSAAPAAQARTGTPAPVRG
jgi:O-antigen ligase